MLKFVVLLFKKPGLTDGEFDDYFHKVHGPLALALPGLRRYVQNRVLDDPKRRPPGWHAVAELYFKDRDTMEAAWESPQGVAATNDLERFADLDRTTWSVVEETVLI